MTGDYLSCMGLKFDNNKGVCDWGEDVDCESDRENAGASSDDGSDGGESGEKGKTYSGKMETATAFRPMGGSWQAEGDDVKGEPGAWNGGSDWGGSWVEGVW